jgi:N-succinyldiaminopimelate aminotransferase
MPKAPHVSESVAGIKGSVYSKLLHRLKTHQGEVYPFHVGDTWKRPPEGCSPDEILAAGHPGLNQYTPPQGIPRLVDLVVERVRARTGAPVERENVFVSGGATAGLMAAVGAVVGPGDEVLILAPHWPLIDGITRMFGATPVPVPVLLSATSATEIVSALEARTSRKTAALYVNTPSNPTGRVLPGEWLAALAGWARARDLWLFFDEVYEETQFEGEHTYGFPLAPERSLALHSFSKAYGMAGHRVGYVVGPKGAMEEALKLHTHSTYSAPTASQWAAARVLEGAGDAWARAAREEYRRVGAEAAALLGVPAPQGSTFLFLDVAPRLGPGGLPEFLEGCADDGLFAAPGPSFGPFPAHVRVCTTACPPDVVMRGMKVLARRLGRQEIGGLRPVRP